MSGIKEVWKPVKGFKGVYIVSNHGNLKSLDREFVDSIGRRRPVKGINKSCWSDKDGYIVSRISYKGKTHICKLHRLVAEAFIPNIENKPCVNHINGFKSDNEVSNLEWVTVKENNIHAHDLVWRAYDKGTKLPDKDIVSVYNMFISGDAVSKISKDFNLTLTHVYSILKGNCHKRLFSLYSLKINKSRKDRNMTLVGC